MTKLNKGNDFINLDEILVDLKLTPDVLEVPIPRYFVQDRSKALRERRELLEGLVEKYQVQLPDENALPAVAPLTEEEAIRIIQVHDSEPMQHVPLLKPVLHRHCIAINLLRRSVPQRVHHM